jgi:hypothetical protein
LHGLSTAVWLPLLQDVVRRYKEAHPGNWDLLPERVAFQVGSCSHCMLLPRACVTASSLCTAVRPPDISDINKPPPPPRASQLRVQCRQCAHTTAQLCSRGSVAATATLLQLNDTHPTIAVPELMRILMDENKLGWTRSWAICTKV